MENRVDLCIQINIKKNTRLDAFGNTLMFHFDVDSEDPKYYTSKGSIHRSEGEGIVVMVRVE